VTDFPNLVTFADFMLSEIVDNEGCLQIGNISAAFEDHNDQFVSAIQYFNT
jgi:hypothetical protein